MCQLFFISPRQLDDGAAAFWLAILGASNRELARPVHRAPLARLARRVHKARLDRLDRKVFPVRLRRRAASALKSADGAIAWAEQFAAPAADCH